MATPGYFGSGYGPAIPAPVGGGYFGTPLAAQPAYVPVGGGFFGTPAAQQTQWPGLAQTVNRAGVPKRFVPGTPAQQAAQAVQQATNAAGVPKRFVPGAGSTATGSGAAQARLAQAAAAPASAPAHPFAQLGNAATTAARPMPAHPFAQLGTAPAAASGGAGNAGLLASLGGRGALLRAGGYAGLGYMAGQMGGGLVESATGADDGTVDDALRNATAAGLTGAGIGAGVGTLGGPFAPISVPVGAAIGGGLGFIGGGIHGLLTGRDSKETEAARALAEQTEKFNEAFDQYEVSPEAREQFLMMFQLGAADLGRKDINALAQDMRANSLPQLVLQDAAMQEEQRGQAAMFAAMQSWMAPQMERVFARSQTSADALSQSMLASAELISDPAQRAFAMDDARRVPLDNATQQAYAMQQMMALPGLYGYNTPTNNQGVPQMDFQSVLGATPINQPAQYGPPVSAASQIAAMQAAGQSGF